MEVFKSVKSYFSRAQPTSYNLGDSEQNWQAHTRLLDVTQEGGSVSIDVDLDPLSQGNGTAIISTWLSPTQPFEFQPISLSSVDITGNVTVTAYHKNDGTNYEPITAWTQTLTTADDDVNIIFGVKQWFWDDFKVALVTDDATASVFTYKSYIVARGG